MIGNGLGHTISCLDMLPSLVAYCLTEQTGALIDLLWELETELAFDSLSSGTFPHDDCLGAWDLPSLSV